jgi:hypothetical protein
MKKITYHTPDGREHVVTREGQVIEKGCMILTLAGWMRFETDMMVVQHPTITHKKRLMLQTLEADWRNGRKKETVELE